MTFRLLAVFFIGVMAGISNNFLTYLMDLAILGSLMVGTGAELQIRKELAQLEAVLDFAKRLSSK